MQIRQVIRLDSGDRARQSTIEAIFSMVGGHDLPESERRFFGRVRGNDFTLDDIRSIRAIVLRESARPVPTIFLDARLQETWATGARQARVLAVADMERFTADLLLDMQEADRCDVPRPWP